MRVALLLLLPLVAGADNSAPTPAPPACHSAQWRGIEQALAAWCKTHPGRGIHGSCNDWLRAFRGCNGDFERANPGWHIVVRLNDCHDPVVEVVPEKKAWRVERISMKSYLPTPGRPGTELELELDPSPSPRR